MKYYMYACNYQIDYIPLSNVSLHFDAQQKILISMYVAIMYVHAIISQLM